MQPWRVCLLTKSKPLSQISTESLLERLNNHAQSADYWLDSNFMPDYVERSRNQMTQFWYIKNELLSRGLTLAWDRNGMATIEE